MNKILLLSSFVLLTASALFAQQERRLIQFSGVVVTGDSLAPVPFTNVFVKGTYRGTMSDVYGYFSFVAQEKDTILFSAVGFERSSYVIPSGLEERKYSMIHVMYEDTVQLRTLKVYPWPSREQFREAFINLRLPADEEQIALKNMSEAELIQRLENLPPDAYASFHYQMALDQTRLYSQGGAPVINLFNPIAWAQFVQAWKNGEFKKKDR